jgi:hypothetical protein
MKLTLALVRRQRVERFDVRDEQALVRALTTR